VRRALVLGGGGITGLAWETGLLAGLAQRGADLAGAADVLGTSAGSIAGSWITTGRDLLAEAEDQMREPAAASASPAPPDPQRVARMFARWSSIQAYSPEQGREVGGIALELGDTHEALWVDAIGRQIGDAPWPAALRVTAVDAGSGEVRVFDAGSGALLARAVAASCAVPAIAPTVRIDGRRYMDGAVPTGTHAHRALEHEVRSVLVVAAFDERTPGIGPLMARTREAELARLREAGVRVAVIRPSQRAAEVMRNAMDASQRAAAAEAGLEQGRSETAALDDWLL
jgi:NTE family protein